MRAVFLVGFMGAGKSSVGRRLAEHLGWEFEDLDDRIVRREGRIIAEIFRDSGEQEFRRAESGALQELLEELERGGGKVVALGGGAFVHGENAKRLRAVDALTVFLDAPVDELWRRCQKQAEETGAERPLLGSRERFRELHDSRRAGYMKASCRINTGERTVSVVAKEIARTLAAKAD